MTWLLMLAIAAMAVLLADTRGRLKRLEQQAPDRRRGPGETDARSGDAPLAPNGAPKAEPLGIAKAIEPPARPAPPKPRSVRQRGRQFEDLAGKQLPIWIGGIALACAAFFLVRYSIELGLFGPLARSVLAALFGIALLVLAEFGSALPRVGPSFSADRRLAQSLAGAGIATLYGTLYMATELYGLVGLGMGLLLVVAVTAAALYLSQRHGPPTALMGLTGGYLAPYVAGLPEASLTLTILYLAIFTAGLLALAFYRRWTWLAWCASGASLVWTVSLIAVADPGERTTVGLLVLAVAVAAAAVLARDPPGPRPLRLALPLAAGILQLAALTALADFTPLAWAIYLAMSAATIVLARRQPVLMPAAWGSLVVAVTAVTGSFAGNSLDVGLFVPPLAFALLYGGAGQAFAFREPLGRAWSWLAACAPAAILAGVALGAAGQGIDWAWGLACLLAAATAALVALRADRRDERDSADVAVAVAMAALVGTVGYWLPYDLLPLGLALLYAGLCGWRQGRGALHGAIGLAAAGLAAFAMLLAAGDMAAIPLRALAGERVHFAAIGALGDLALGLAAPAVVLIAADRRGWQPRTGTPVGRLIGGIALGAFLYAVAKQPFAIADATSFARFGFVERALITHALALGGWALLRCAPSHSLRQRAGLVLAGFALFRFAWFDLVLLNPVAVRQALPGAPVVNAATAHVAAVAAWLWMFARPVGALPGGNRAAALLELGSFATMALTVLITVRQGIHGAIVDQAGVTRTENYLFSAGLLLLALVWLGLGIARSAATLRLSGLALLTLITLKVFLVDAAALEGLLRVFSFLGLGAALIGIGWAYGRVGPVGRRATTP